MIALSEHSLLVMRDSGESVPLSAEMIAVEISGGKVDCFDAELIGQAAAAVFHYFKHELGRQFVTANEFSDVLRTVLHGLGLQAGLVKPAVTETAEPQTEFDLHELAEEGGELFFFPRLREQLKRQLDAQPDSVRFSRLRPCVKRLTGAKRWSPRCSELEQRIVDYLRSCLSAEAGAGKASLVVQ